MKETTHNKNKRKTFSFRRRERTLYFMTLVALLAAGAFGYLLVPTSGTISAQSGGRHVQDLITIEPTQKSELATPDMSEDALNAITNDFSEFRPVKVCKIAGPGIPLNTNFTFRVVGKGHIDAVGTIGDVERTVEVAAGIPSDGRICAFIPGFGAGAGSAEFQTFVVGSVVQVSENPRIVNNGQIRVSRVRVSTAANRPSEFAVNFVVGSDVVEVEFTNFLFRPTILKICKAAAVPVLVGQPFTVTITFVSPTGAGGNLFPSFSTTTTVNAGSNNQGGNCNIVSGNGLIGGAFNQGSTVTISENAAPGTIVTNITSPTSAIPAFVSGARTTTLTGDEGLVEGVTQVAFTNTATSAL